MMTKCNETIKKMKREKENKINKWKNEEVKI